jgi:prolyl-tRNA synthetase
MKKHNTLGIESDKITDTNNWYTEVIIKGELIDYTDVSGCYILKPKAQFIWDRITEYMNKIIRNKGVKNASFPLLIPEKFLLKEAKHIEGFSPEVAWVTHAGNTELKEKLALRPTSESIMYPLYAKWIRSYKDLPLKLNQWCNVIRWEFNNPMPFLRSREFFWQEGHSAFATKKEAEEEAKDILIDLYKKTYEDLMAIPSLAGMKSEKEKFAGADYSLSCEVFLPMGKAIQGCTSHHLGQNFSKVFNIKFKDKEQKDKLAYQNSWGWSTRVIGVMIMMHSDNKGLVIPPKLAENKIIIVPAGKSNQEDVKVKCDNLIKDLEKFNPIYDNREGYSFAWKLNDAELKGYPIRIELGKRELDENNATVVRRDTLDKIKIPLNELKNKIPTLLQEIHDSMFNKAKNILESNIIEEYTDLEKIKSLVKNNKIVKTLFDGRPETDKIIKDLTTGKTLNIPFDSEVPKNSMCPFSKNKAKFVVYIAKSL